MQPIIAPTRKAVFAGQQPTGRSATVGEIADQELLKKVSESSPPNEPSFRKESELMDRLREGYVEAFEDLLQRLWRPTYLYCLSLGCDVDRAEDFTQEAFVKLWERSAQWITGGSVRAWLFRTVRHLVFSEQRKRKVRLDWAQRGRSEGTAGPRTPLQEIESLQVRQAINGAVASLSPRRREAFTLVHLQGLSYTETAEVMGVKPQSVANYLTAALSDLRTSLRDIYPSLGQSSSVR